MTPSTTIGVASGLLQAPLNGSSPQRVWPPAAGAPAAGPAPPGGGVSGIDHTGASRVTLAVLISVNGEKRVPAWLRLYIGQSPPAGPARFVWAASTTPMDKMTGAADAIDKMRFITERLCIGAWRLRTSKNDREWPVRLFRAARTGLQASGFRLRAVPELTGNSTLVDELWSVYMMIHERALFRAM